MNCWCYTKTAKGIIVTTLCRLTQRIVRGVNLSRTLVSLEMGSFLAGAKFGGVKCSYGRVDIMRSFRAKSYGSEMFIND
ncbi:hypothetical protein E3N88_23365 [Mikania micrantha]|uniref:Uncharacterized protein n=1 Tax=Mikania micrantha TaxID=192012 RepID=A0A5N6NDB7_9ASTR|nr:hypothetical protein E3N88_23365 [Mikania micrantha]